MVLRIGWISMGGLLSCEFGEKPASITDPGRYGSPLGCEQADGEQADWYQDQAAIIHCKALRDTRHYW